MHRDHPALEKTGLFERLRLGHAAKVTVLTPNRRLAQALQRDYDREERERGLEAWETADILPFNAFVERLWEDALYSEVAAGVPLLLTPAQEQTLWEEALHATRLALLSPAPAAAQCRAAWQIAHAWRLLAKSAGAPNEDTRVFLEWAARYERATREKGQTDSARLPDVVAPLLPHAALRKPAQVVLFGFDIVTLQMREFLDALAGQGCAIVEAAPRAREGVAARVELTEAKDEIAAAARWARSRMEADPKARIGVVVPDLARSRARVQRTFANVMQPDHMISGTATALPFNLSLGTPLADYSLVSDALLVLALAGREVAFTQASRLVLSPYIGGAETEMGVRARLDARLRERCAPAVSLDGLIGQCAAGKAPRAPLLLDRLARLSEFRKASLFGARTAPEWAKAFSEALRIAGFPGERTLDSAEHQTLDKWHELLADFATLERVTAKMGFADACQRLRGMARDTIFQPEARDVPIQIVGVLESAGLEFDHLWVMGLTDDAWPLPARPNPFIPVSLQRAAGIPQADPVSSLELDRRITQGWLHAAGEVVLSHSRMRDESELSPSPLIAAVAPAALADLRAGPYELLRDAIRRGGALEVVNDPRAPPATAPTNRGGTGLFRDQAACPFRAFARYRMGSEPLETPRPGLDARDRGTLLHHMLALVWKSLQTRARLDAAGDELEALLEKCAGDAIALMRRYRADVLSGRFAQLERARLVRLTREWLAVERRRGDFEVVATEEKRALTFGGVTVNAKLDRMDRLAAGGCMVIDYKTGPCATAAWMGTRPDEPQLPMYALGGGEDIAAVAFGQVKAGQMAFKGIARVPDIVAGVQLITKDRSAAAKRYRDWNALADGWRDELESIGRSFASGDARVDPRDGRFTCERCDQQTLCRIAEKAPFGAVGESEPDE